MSRNGDSSMKNKINSIIIIIFTVITVCVMIAIKNYNDKIYADDDRVLVLKSKVNNEGKPADKKEEFGKSDGTAEHKIPNKSMDINNAKSEPEPKAAADTAKNSDNSNKSKAAKKENSVIVPNTSTISGNEEPSDYKNTVRSNEDGKESLPVFKVARCEAINKLSVKDKVTLLLISKSLSKEDYNAIQQDLSDEDAQKGVSNAIRLLKNRLSSKDFDKIKEIASKVINLDTLTF